MDTDGDPGEAAFPGVDQSRFRIEVQALIGPFYGVRVLDTTTGRRVPLARGGRMLLGRSSVRRAVRYGVERYLRSHPGRRGTDSVSRASGGGGPRGRAEAPYTRAMLTGGAGGPYVVPPRLLIVDDDPNLLVVLAEQFRADGYEVQTARDGEEALRRLRTGWPDLLIVDMMMPRMDGLTLAREIKATADLPIIVLSAIDAGDSKADLLEEFAEDYVTKPYHYPELRARVNRVLRRLGDKVPRQSLVLGPDLTLDLHRRSATVRGQEVQLTPTESRLLYALAANLGQTVPTDTLLARGWAETDDADPSYVWVTMRRLRQKVELDPNRPIHLQTVRGIGYRLVASDAPG
jgi:DNA-binding response OmpR family regulator